MENILYLDDYINFYDKKTKRIISFKPYKHTLKNGLIIDSKKFINSYKKMKSVNNIVDTLINEKIILIVNSNYHADDRNKIKDILEELNYKNVKIINEVDLLNLNKNNIFINYNNTYFNIYYINDLNKVDLITYKKNNVNNSLVINILEYLNKENIIIFGKNYKELINIFKDTNYNYYFYEYSENLFINLLLKN